MSKDYIVAQQPASGTANTKNIQGVSNLQGSDLVFTPANTLVDASGVDAVGTGATGVSQPAGGGGILGWLSGIYQRLGGTLKVEVTNQAATQAVSLDKLPAFAATPTVNLGTLNGAATDQTLNAIGTELHAQTVLMAQAQDVNVKGAVPLPTGAATEATMLLVNQSLVTLTKHLAIHNILLSEMTDQGKTSLNQMLNDPTVLSY